MYSNELLAWFNKQITKEVMLGTAIDVIGCERQFYGNLISARVEDNNLLITAKVRDFYHYCNMFSASEKAVITSQMDDIVEINFHDQKLHFPYSGGILIGHILNSDNFRQISELTQSLHQPIPGDIITINGMHFCVTKPGQLMFSNNSMVELNNPYDYFYKAPAIGIETKHKRDIWFGMGNKVTTAADLEKELKETIQRNLNSTHTSLLAYHANALNRLHFLMKSI